MKNNNRGRPLASIDTVRRSRLLSRAIACALAGVAGAAIQPATAGQFVLDNGVEGTWGLNVSLGTSVRTTDPDRQLIMIGNGGTGGSSHDDGNLNYDDGDAFSTLAKVIGELTLKRDNLGVMVRAKGWYDFTLENHGVDHGHSANGFRAGADLNDGDFDALSKFSGVALLDAYVFGDFSLGDHPLAVKLGDHVVNWGESLFIPGINQFGAFDVSASRRPGAQVKEILLPIPQISANAGLSDNLSLEAFYQFRWRKNVLDGCGTYWSISDVYNCSDQGVVIPAGPLGTRTDFENYNGLQTGLGPFPAGIDAVMANGGDREPSDGGQWGLASRWFAQGISTEFGLYYVNYHQRSPVISILLDGSPPGSVFAIGNNRMQYSWDWSAEDIKVLGASFSTTLGGWSVFGEVSRTRDLPLQLNGLDLLRGASSGAGPLGFLVDVPRDEGILYTGYDRKDKTQLQLSTLKIFSRVLGAESLQLMGEIGYQRWSGIGDPMTSRRYGRAFLYGQAVTRTLDCAGTGNVEQDFCEAKGFATTTAWGYRGQATLSYPRLFGSVNVKPRLFWQHDVKGYSGDMTFVEDRKILGLGAAFDYLGKYYADLSYSRFNSDAKYDTFRDRDFVSIVAGMNF
ncbi:MAG TPA: DUF1302 domain-containing protein [Dokdonella sp.]|uniref:DUF1302 domain-containing protein n=1 Tax=Dokdonella sp. TaxID=2291710 RepID=UPI002CFF74F7|nr:DUF1302 domain-containing protein [Dokdonella sp.]HUD42507.1 DUF1302 domain-containing protein [Dokdonella sp.]